jgi:hypothetical protein
LPRLQRHQNARASKPLPARKREHQRSSVCIGG